MTAQTVSEHDKATPTKRSRWATQRLKGKQARNKRMSIMDRLHKGTHQEKKRDSGGAESLGTASGGVQAGTTIDGGSETGEETEDGREARKIFINMPLPSDLLNDQGRPSAHFARNKIRTAKYTPLTFIPKNLFYQFHNVANIYFLLLVILAFFPIFGVTNPGLNSAPLIFILVVTAIKDAIEDSRRTILDNELNNAPVYRLVGWTNVNVSQDSISLWRRIKKACTRSIKVVIHLTERLIRRPKSEGVKEATLSDHALDGPRISVDTRHTQLESVYSVRTSFASAREDIQMTPVASPTPPQAEPDAATAQQLTLAKAHANGKASEQVDSGDVINHQAVASGNAKFQNDFWKNVQVGDFLRIYNNDQIPADIIVLSSSDPEGACYVETKNLDGETNLKLRHALRCGRALKHARDCERAEFMIESEGPQPNLYQYSAVARWTEKNKLRPEAPEELMSEPISINNMLLRGCNLRNTEWVLGVVVFTGRESKIMLNSGITPSKRSRITRELNWNVAYNFGILLIMCVVSGIIQGSIWSHPNSSIQFFEFGSIGGTPALGGFITFVAAVILFQNLVPISLYISLEIIRTAQAFFIYSDSDMYYEKLDYPCAPRSWNISDDLGQIEYIFSDKTGTLTQNVMEFKKVTINGVPYGEAYTEAQAGMQRRQGINVDEESAKARKQIEEARVRMLKEIRKLHNNPYLHDDQLTFIAPDFIMDLVGESGLEQQRANEEFMMALALCHTVIAETTPGDPPRIEFKAQSPDEAALVATARDVGFTVLGNTQHGIRLNVQGEDREYTVLNTLEFNSTRKRMSAIVRMPDGKIILYCKGADSVIYSRLKKGEQPELRRATAEHLEMFAREGLRTLCIAQRILSEEEYQHWNEEHKLAATAIQDREEKLENVAQMIEQELTLLGGTAIEDRLQEGVPDTIALLADAGIKLWVLTGDKVETAINIGFSCNLLNNDMELILLKIEDETLKTAEAELDRHLRTFKMTGSDEELKAAQKIHEPPDPTHALVIDGDSLRLVLDESLQQKFLLLCKQCKSVLCCRVSPAQKASVVHLVKQGLDVMTLSVGDGANDVAMIQEADIGVGIAGEEGRQAVMSSDYAIGQFRFLQRLILVHGRWSYRRLGETIANFFYKNMVWTFAIFWYQIYANFDQTYIYDYTYILLYNLAFTSLPVIFMGILDQDISDKVSLAVPQLYRRGIERKEWTQSKFWLYMLDGIYQSLISWFLVYLEFGPGNFVSKSGQDISDRNRMGLFIACAVVIVVNTYVLLNTYRWDWLMLLLVSISILLVFFWTGVWGANESLAVYFYRAAPQVLGQASFWAVTFLVVVACLLPRFTIKSIQKVYFPYDVDIIREQVRQGEFDYLEGSDGSRAAKSPTSSTVSSESKPAINEDERPIYPASVATAHTHNARSQHGSDGTDYTKHNQVEPKDPPLEAPPRITDLPLEAPPRISTDRPRPSFDRMRASMDRIRSSYEASHDFTSAAMLTRMESSNSFGPITPIRSRRKDFPDSPR